MKANEQTNLSEYTNRLYYLRKYLLKMGQGEFAKHINISRTTYSNIENGTTKLTDRVAGDICREFSVNPEWLFNGTKPIGAEGGTAITNMVSLYEQLCEANRKHAQQYLNSLLESQNDTGASFTGNAEPVKDGADTTLNKEEVSKLRKLLALLDSTEDK